MVRYKNCKFKVSQDAKNFPDYWQGVPINFSFNGRQSAVIAPTKKIVIEQMKDLINRYLEAGLLIMNKDKKKNEN